MKLYFSISILRRNHGAVLLRSLSFLYYNIHATYDVTHHTTYYDRFIVLLCRLYITILLHHDVNYDSIFHCSSPDDGYTYMLDN
jgi:hypothetical protein